MLRRVARGVVGGLFVAGYLVMAPTIAPAGALQSANYTLIEGVIGSGGLNQSSSSSFQVRSSAGSLAVGNAASGNTQIETGPVTTNDPALSFSFDDPDAKFGSFTSSGATMTTTAFSISNYTSYGYVVQIVGEPPSNGDYVIDPMSETGTSQPGTNQFGINLVANTLPESIGANPDHGNFGFGDAAPNYATPNQYRYVSGETIATASKSSGVTKYTISYLVNVDDLAPGGVYSSDQTIIVTGTY